MPIHEEYRLGPGSVLPSPSPSLRVGPFRGGRQIASLWRFWTTGDEVYVANRNFARLVRVSLHSSGASFCWVGAHRKDLAAPCLLPGEAWSHALEIVWLIPEDSLPVPEIKEVKKSKPAIVIETPPDQKLVLNVLYGATRATTHETALPEIMNGGRLMQARLPCGTQVTVIGRLLPFSDQDLKNIATGRGDSITGVHVRGPNDGLERTVVHASPRGNIITVIGCGPNELRTTG